MNLTSVKLVINITISLDNISYWITPLSIQCQFMLYLHIFKYSIISYFALILSIGWSLSPSYIHALKCFKIYFKSATSVWEVVYYNVIHKWNLEKTAFQNVKKIQFFYSISNESYDRQIKLWKLSISTVINYKV